MLVEVLSAVSAEGEVDDEVGLGGLLSIPVGVGAEISKGGETAAGRGGGGDGVDDSTNGVGLDLSEGSVESHGGGVATRKVDNTNGDDVVAGSEGAVGATDESVALDRLTSGGSGRGRDVTGRKVLSDELDSVDVDDVAGTSLDSQLKALIAGNGNRNGGSEEPDVLSVGGGRIGGIVGSEATDGSNSVPVGNEVGGVGPRGGGLGEDLVRDFVSEILGAISTLVDGGDGIEVALAIGHLDVKSGVLTPAIVVAIGKVDVDGTSGEAVEHVLSIHVAEDRGVVDGTSRIGDGVGLFTSPALTDLHETDNETGGSGTGLSVQSDLGLRRLGGDDADSRNGVGS